MPQVEVKILHTYHKPDNDLLGFQASKMSDDKLSIRSKKVLSTTSRANIKPRKSKL